MKISSAVTLMILGSLGVAHAAGGNLAWDNCLPSPGSAANKTFICDDSSPGAGDANTQEFSMFVSLVPGIDIPAVCSCEAEIMLAVANPILDDWWRLGLGECRGPTDTSPGAFAYRFNGFTNVTTCDRDLMNEPKALGTFYWASSMIAPNRAVFELIVTRPHVVSVSATVQYQLFEVVIDSRNTKFASPSDSLGNQVCSGCQDAASFVLSRVQLDGPCPPCQHYVYSGTWNDRGWVTWQGDPTPAKRMTWGNIRSIYR